jgi:hypothetical protein
MATLFKQYYPIRLIISNRYTCFNRFSGGNFGLIMPSLFSIYDAESMHFYPGAFLDACDVLKIGSYSDYLDSTV